MDDSAREEEMRDEKVRRREENENRASVVGRRV
jgi:hypothetical protein